jgi:outer membrane protein OmpA-like peptidoglycan-associated protein
MSPGRSAILLSLLAAAALTRDATHARAGPYIVFFDTDQARLSDQTMSILDRAVYWYRASGSSGLAVLGHSDRAGTAPYNSALSRRRAEAVRDYLARQGIPARAMRIEAHGERLPLVETPDGVAELQNRRVELIFYPPSK